MIKHLLKLQFLLPLVFCAMSSPNISAQHDEKDAFSLFGAKSESNKEKHTIQKYLFPSPATYSVPVIIKTNSVKITAVDEIFTTHV